MTTTPQPITRKLIASFSVLALGLGLILGSGAPVRANSDNVAKVIAGAAALAIIGTAINKAERDDDRERARRVQGHPPPHGWHRNGPQRPHGWQHREPPRHARPHRSHGQDCVRTRHGEVVCGRAAGQVRARPHDRRDHGWDNDRRRHDRDRRDDRRRDHRRD